MKNKNLHIRISEQELLAAKARADSYGLKVSELARRAMLGEPLPEPSEQSQHDPLDEQPPI